MKTLANCKPSEFLKQTYRIKNAAQEWMDAVDVIAIRKRMPKLELVTKEMSDEERLKTFEENKRRSEAQARKNVMDIIDSALGENADKTLEIMALVCFVEPEDVDNHDMSEYLEAMTDVLRNSAVINFFTSLAQLGLIDMSDASEQSGSTF